MCATFDFKVKQSAGSIGIEKTTLSAINGSTIRVPLYPLYFYLVTAAHFKIGHPWTSFTGARSSNVLLRLDNLAGYQYSNPSNSFRTTRPIRTYTSASQLIPSHVETDILPKLPTLTSNDFKQMSTPITLACCRCVRDGLMLFSTPRTL